MLLCSCVSNQRLALVAKQQVGSHYKKGQSAQCAAFVAHCVHKAGKEPPAWPNKARNWLKWGTPVPYLLKQPGDVIITHRNGRNSGDGHIMIYVGNGKAVHRSTLSKPVETINVDHYRDRVLGVRRG